MRLTSDNLDLINKSYRSLTFSAQRMRSPTTLFQILGRVYQTNEVTEFSTDIEGITGGDFIAENAPYPQSKLQNGWNASATARNWGFDVSISENTHQAFDDVTLLFGKTRGLELQMGTTLHYNHLETEFHKFFNLGFGVTGFLAPDGAAPFGVHTFKSTGTTFTNGVTGAGSVLSDTSIATMEKYAGAFKDATGKEMPLQFDTILVKQGGSAFVAAQKLFNSNIFPQVTGNYNIYGGGKYNVIESPYITSDTAWFALKSRPAVTDMDERPFAVGHKFISRVGETLVNSSTKSVITGTKSVYKMWCDRLPIAVYGAAGV